MVAGISRVHKRSNSELHHVGTRSMYNMTQLILSALRYSFQRVPKKKSTIEFQMHLSAPTCFVRMSANKSSQYFCFCQGVFDFGSFYILMPSFKINQQIHSIPNFNSFRNWTCSRILTQVSLLFFFIIAIVLFVNQEAAPTITAAFTEPSYLTLPHQQCPPLALVP